ncbi:uncharacterized protein EV154DRAFT_488393 [Mucor mucedo]|uniref:uncharacterized protein n=1 Tax=Mucor mucedo TaxID=29922 RepID=UPI00221EBA0C|nr:uncharacterized protein EV154DRAFT_488393 [Mucor mucedo]KAI7867210.1 hypothetical protein EV154DRAFT_488393 [Mucor mucedo]
MFLPDDFRLDDPKSNEDWTPRFIKRPRLDQGNDKTQGNDQMHPFPEDVGAFHFEDYDTNDGRGYMPEDDDQDYEDTVETLANLHHLLWFLKMRRFSRKKAESFLWGNMKAKALADQIQIVWVAGPDFFYLRSKVRVLSSHDFVSQSEAKHVRIT